jgi:hypothetical protein
MHFGQTMELVHKKTNVKASNFVPEQILTVVLSQSRRSELRFSSVFLETRKITTGKTQLAAKRTHPHFSIYHPRLARSVASARRLRETGWDIRGGGTED